MAGLRLFIALPLSEEIKVFMTSLTRARFHGTNVRWLHRDSYHLTIRFLGDTPEEMIPSLRCVLDDVAIQVESQPLYLTHLGSFPDDNRATVLWIGLNDLNGIIAKLVILIEDQLGKLGLPIAKGTFIPHVTLGRISRPRPVAGWSRSLEPLSYNANSIVLFQSILSRAGARYEGIHSAALGGSSKESRTFKGGLL